MPALDLVIRVTGNVGSALNALGSVQSGIQGMSRSAAITGGTLTATITAPLAAAFRAAIGPTIDMQTNLNVLASVANLSKDQLTQAGVAARQLGADVTIPGANAADAAQAMVELGKAGLSFDNIMKAASGTLRLAAAGELSVRDAAEITGKALNAFRLEGSQATRVADLLAAAANSSSASVAEMALSFQQGSAAAASANVPIDVFTATLAVLANRGIAASDAGTSFKTFMASLAKDTKPAIAAQKLLGISFFDAAGKMKPFLTIAEDLRVKTANLTEKQRETVFNKIFGSDAGRIARILASLNEGELADMVTNVNRSGAAADFANARMQGLGGALEKLQNAWDTLNVTVLGRFLPQMTSAVDLVTRLVGWMDSLSPETQNAALAFAAVLAAAGPLLLVFSGLTGALAFLLTPFGLVTAALAGLAALLGSGALRNTSFGRAMTDLGQTIRKAFEAETRHPIALVLAALDRLTGLNVTGWVNGISRAFRVVRDAFLTFVGALSGDWLDPNAGGLQGAIAGLQILTRVLSGEKVAEINPIHRAIGNIGLFIRNVAIPALREFTGWLQTVAIPALLRVAQFIDTTVLPALERFGGWFLGRGLPGMLGWVGAILGLVLPAAERFGNWFQTQALPALAAFADHIVTNVLPQVESMAIALGTTALDAAQRLGSWFASDGIPLLERFGALGLEVWRVIGLLLGPAFEALQANASEITAAFVPLTTAVRDLLVSLEPLASFVGSVLAALTAALPGFLTMLTGFVTGISGVVDALMALLGGLRDALVALGQGDTAGALAALQRAWEGITAASAKAERGAGHVTAGQAAAAAAAQGVLGRALGITGPGAGTGGSRGFGDGSILPGLPGAGPNVGKVGAGFGVPTAEEIERQKRYADETERATRAMRGLADAGLTTDQILRNLPGDVQTAMSRALEI